MTREEFIRDTAQQLLVAEIRHGGMDRICAILAARKRRDPTAADCAVSFAEELADSLPDGTFATAHQFPLPEKSAYDSSVPSALNLWDEGFDDDGED